VVGLVMATLCAQTASLRIPARAAPFANLPSARGGPVLASLDMNSLPGDPSLVLQTSVSIADKKSFLKAASAAIATSLSKPEAYVAVCIHDGMADSMLFGGTDQPCAVGCVYSIGSINQENNGALTSAISALLEPHGVAANRIYINFFDVPRANCGWSGRTFAG